MRIIEDASTRLVLRHSWWADLRFALGVFLFSLCLIAGAVLLIGNPLWWHIPELDYSHGREQPAVVTTIAGCFAAILGAACLLAALQAGLHMRTREYAFDAVAGTFRVRARRPLSSGSDASYPLGAIARIAVDGASGSWWVLVQLADVGPLILPRPASMRAVLGAIKDSSALRASLMHGYMLDPGWDRERTEQLAAKVRQLLGQPTAQP
jgi:hypothetical protein